MRNNYLWYQFFRYGVVRPALRLFHSDVTVSGSEHIPKDRPVIFVANHQNALLDPLHVVSNTGRIIHFLTRAEPFEMPVLKHFFRSLNMIPVYRVRDGFGTIKKNKKTFEQCFTYLQQNDCVLVFAEADHDLKRRVRPLSKGFTRIAFGAEQQSDWNLDLQIIPVGLNYGRHRKSRRPVHVEFGECIPIADFRQIFLKDEREAAQKLKKATKAGLKKTTMHVPKLNNYPLHHLLLDELDADRNTLLDPQKINQGVSAIENQNDGELLDDAKKLLNQVQEHNLDVKDFVSSSRIRLRDILLSPFYLFSLINNLLPYQLIRWVTVDYIEDHVFDGSAKFLLGLLLLPFYYLVASGLLGLAGLGSLSMAVYFLISIISAPLFVDAKDLLQSNNEQKLKKEKPRVYESIKSKVEEFTQWREEVI